MTTNEKDRLIWDMILSSSTRLTDEQMKEIEQEAPWFKFTDDGIEYSRGMIELLKYEFRALNDYF